MSGRAGVVRYGQAPPADRGRFLSARACRGLEAPSAMSAYEYGSDTRVFRRGGLTGPTIWRPGARHRPGRARKKSRSCCKTSAAAARRVRLRDQTAGRTTPLNTKIPSSTVIAAEAMVVNVSSDTARLSSRGSFRTYSAAEDRCPARGPDIPVGRVCRVSGRPHAVEWCPVRSLRTPRTASQDSRRAEGALAQQQDPQLAFREQFDALVKASGLSIRDIAKQTGTRRSTLDGWKNGKSLPQELDALLKVVRALQAAAGQDVDRQFSERRWRALLSDAKQARDDRASRRTPGVSRNRELAAERRARSIDATTTAKEAFGGLRDLAIKPDWTQERASYARKEPRALSPDEQALVDGWEARRNGLIGTVKNAILDIEDPDLRARLKQAVQVLELWHEPMSAIRQSESRTRFLATADALEALGAYRRGDPAPDQDAAYQKTIVYVDLYLAAWGELEALKAAALCPPLTLSRRPPPSPQSHHHGSRSAH